MPQYRAPIGIMSFDRPDYFEKVLQSFVLQTGGELGSRPIYLFQDGARNPFSGNTYASQEKIDANIKLFRQYLPQGIIMDSRDNLGVALNYDRAERLFFEERGDDAAIFLEDDLIFSPFYIEILDRLVELARNDPRIGYISAVGNHMLSLDEQRRRGHELATLQQTWGFALTRRQWVANQPYLEKYLKLVRGIDYRKRSHLDIFDLYTSWGASRSLSSQDRAKYIASTLNSNLWISTVPSFGKYIGAIGLHCNEEMYAAGRFGETNLFPEPLESFTELTDDQYRALLDQQLREISATPPTLQLNRELSFGIGHSGFLALGKGFHLPEKWGVWAATKTPRITIRPPNIARDGEHALRIKCRYNMPPGQSEISVAVRIDGKDAGSLRWDGTQQALAVSLPRADVSRGEPMTVEFLAPMVDRPSDIHSSGDMRPLGLGLHSVAIVLARDDAANEIGKDDTANCIKSALTILTGAEPSSSLLQRLSGTKDLLEVRERLLHDPIISAQVPDLRLAYEISMLRAARASGEIRLIVGASGTHFAGWVPTNQHLLDLLKPDTWRAWLEESSIEAMVAEHVLEHLDEHEGFIAACTCYRFLAPGKRIRIAVPDSFKPDPEYHELCKVGCKDGHKIFYNYKILSSMLEKAGFTVQTLEYWDENGNFQEKEWSSKDGHIRRSHRFDPRNTGGGYVYTSLIVDAIKPAE